MLINWYTWLLIAAILITVVITRIFHSARDSLFVSKFLSVAAKMTLAILLIALVTLEFSNLFVSKNNDLIIDDPQLGTAVYLLPKHKLPANAAAKAAASIAAGSIAAVLSNPSSVVELISQAIDYLQKAQVFYNIPNEMKVGMKEVIQVSIAKEFTEALSQEFQQTSHGITGKKEIQYDPRSIIISLVADPDSFKIYPVEGVKQFIAPGQPATWRWEVKPLKQGSHLLELRAFAEFYIPELGENPYPLPINIFSNQILVKSNLYSLLWSTFHNFWKDFLAVSSVLWVALYFIKEQNNMPENSKYDMRGSTFGNFVDTAQDGSRQQVVQSISISQQQQTLAEAAKSVQELLDYLSKTYSSVEVPAKAEEIIKNDPKLRGRVVGAIKESGKKALEELVKHPSVSILLAAVEGWEKGTQ